MSLKLKAALYTAGFIASICIIATVMELLTRELTADQIVTIVGGGMCAWFVYLIYALMLNRLQYEEKIKQLVDQK